MWLKAFNVVGFQLVWLACVAGAGSGLVWIGPLSAAIFVLTTLCYGGRAAADLRLLAIALPIGFALDTAFAASGCLRYAAAWPSANAAPVWIWAMWAAFALTLNHALAWLRARPALAAVAGFVAAPLSYWTASAFGAVVFGAPIPAVLAAIGLAWAVAVPLLLALARRSGSPRWQERLA